MARLSQSWRHFKGGKTPVRVVHNSLSLDVDARKEVAAVTISLPYPPATNNLYFNAPGVGRVKTERYQNWNDEAAAMIAQQRPGRVAGEFKAEIIVSRPDKRRRDLDGVIKPILDCLVRNRITGDDHLAQEINVVWTAEGSGVRVTVTEARA